MVKRLIVMTVIPLISNVAYAGTPNPICKETPNAIVKDYYSNGKVKTEWGCKDGQLSGITKLYYRNGKLEKKSYYVNDVRQGATTGYYESGALKSICNYKDGELDGLHKIFYENGLIGELTFYKNGMDVGIP